MKSNPQGTTIACKSWQRNLGHKSPTWIIGWHTENDCMIVTSLDFMVESVAICRWHKLEIGDWMHLIGSHPFFDFANEEISAFSKSKSCAHKRSANCFFLTCSEFLKPCKQWQWGGHLWFSIISWNILEPNSLVVITLGSLHWLGPFLFFRWRRRIFLSVELVFLP